MPCGTIFRDTMETNQLGLDEQRSSPRLQNTVDEMSSEMSQSSNSPYYKSENSLVT